MSVPELKASKKALFLLLSNLNGAIRGLSGEGLIVSDSFDSGKDFRIGNEEENRVGDLEVGSETGEVGGVVGLGLFEVEAHS